MLKRRLRRTAAICIGVVAGMVGLAYAAVPLYDLFCRVTGFDGTPRVGTAGGSRILDHTIRVRFDANVAPGLDWRFAPEALEIRARLGETQTVFYKVRNAGAVPTAGIATFNVQPGQAGRVLCRALACRRAQPAEPALDYALVYLFRLKEWAAGCDNERRGRPAESVTSDVTSAAKRIKSHAKSHGDKQNGRRPRRPWSQA
jgi:cytochrome c oxidase assembly protein subunit 11